MASRHLLIGGSRHNEYMTCEITPTLKVVTKCPRSLVDFETYVYRRFGFKHYGLDCVAICYVVEGVSDEQAARLLLRHDTQQDW
jgi:hypothetical protein